MTSLDTDEIAAPDAAECKGHPAGSHGVMGETVYCDGSCRRQALEFDIFTPSPKTDRRSRDAQIAHATNKRGW